MKEWDVITEIKVLLANGMKVSAVSRRLGIDRKTVRKYRDMDMDAIALSRRSAKTRSNKVDKYKNVISEILDRMKEDGIINAQSVYEQIKELGYCGSARTVRRYVNTHYAKASKRPRIFEPFETDPGQQAMVDLGESRKVWFGERKVVMYFIVMTLSYSRKMFVQWYTRPIDTQMFIDFHVNAFRSFGGIPFELVYDQTKLVAIEENYGEIEFNKEFHGFRKWAGFRCYLCNKNDPQTKGKVESSVKYVKRSFLPGRRFTDIDHLRAEYSHWHSHVAAVKKNETTGDSPLERMEKELSSLMPFHDSIYETKPAYKTHRVYQDGFIKVLGNKYSVPWQYHGQQVKVQVTDDSIVVLSQEGKHVYTHELCLEKGKRIKIKEHYTTPESESTIELEKILLSVFEDPRLFDELRKRFPRHYREQYKQIVRLTKQMNKYILQDALHLLFDEHYQISYSALKKAALYLEEKIPQLMDLENCKTVSFDAIPGLKIADRAPNYYQQALEG